MTISLSYALRCIVAFALISMIACPSLSIAQDNTTKLSVPAQEPLMLGELWTGSIYTSTFEAGACFFPDGRMRGVLLLKLKNGQVDTYHFQGTMDSNGIIDAAHKSGHRFVGKFEDEFNVSGEVTLSNGFSTTLSGKRLSNVKLNDRCGPLSE